LWYLARGFQFGFWLWWIVFFIALAQTMILLALGYAWARRYAPVQREE
jgi:hypothetical protein